MVGLCEAKSERQHVVYQDKKSDQALDDDDDDRKKRMGHFIISSSSFDSILLYTTARPQTLPTHLISLFIPCLSLSLFRLRVCWLLSF